MSITKPVYIDGDTDGIRTVPVKSATTYGPDQFTDGALENWNQSIDSDASDFDWDVVGGAAGGKVIKSTNAYFGSYAAQLTTADSYGQEGSAYSRPFIFAEADVSSATDPMTIGFRGKGGAAEQHVGIAVVNNVFDSWTQAYNWTTNAWVNQDDFEDILVSGDYVQDVTLTDAYALYTSETFNKAGATLGIIIVNMDAAATTNYIDNIYVVGNGDNDDDHEFIPTGWEIWDAEYSPIISTDSDTGTYAVQTQASGGNHSGVSQDVEGLTPTHSYTATIRAKSTSGTSTFAFMYGYDDGEDEYLWNFTGDNAGTFTLAGEEPTADQMDVHITTASYATYTTAGSQVVVPAGGAFYVDIVSTANDVFFDNATLKKDGTGDNILTNPGFENWTVGGYMVDGGLESCWGDYAFPTSWVALANGGDNGDMERSENSHGGTYAAQFTLGGQSPAVLTQLKTGLTQDDVYRIDFWAEYETDASNFAVIALDNIPSAATSYYDFDTDTWEALGSPSGQEFTITDTYAEYSDTVTVPASGNLWVMVQQEYVATENATAYADDLTLEKVTYPSSVELAGFPNSSDADNLGEDDYILKVHTTGGTPATQLGFKLDASDNMVLETDRSGLDVSTVPLYVGTPSTATEAVTKGYADTADNARLLYTSLSAEVDMMSTDSVVDLYTVPTGYTFYPTGTWTICTAVTNFSSSGTLYYGITGPDYNDGASISAASTVNSTTNYYINSTVGFAAGSAIKAKVNVVSTADVHKVKVRLIGFLVAT